MKKCPGTAGSRAYFMIRDAGCFYGLEPGGIVCFSVSVKGEGADYLYTLPDNAPRAAGSGWGK
jgi:hypothetical protein